MPKWTKEQRTAYARKWRDANPEKERANKLAYRERNPGYHRRYHLIRNYGLSLEEYDAMLDAQDGKCAICHDTSRLCVDHSHTTGKVRGLLCVKCNTGIGAFRESQINLMEAISYLKERG